MTSSELPDCNGPRIDWDGEELAVSVPIPPEVNAAIGKESRAGTGDALRVHCRWKPAALTVVRIRRVGESRWSPAFQTPLNSVQFSGLEPQTEYEIQITRREPGGEGPPTVSRARTDRRGTMGNVVPFPRS